MIPEHADYVIEYYRNGQVVLVTWHVGEGSRDVEISACRERMRRGEISHVRVTNRRAPFGSYEVWQ